MQEPADTILIFCMEQVANKHFLVVEVSALPYPERYIPQLLVAVKFSEYVGTYCPVLDKCPLVLG